MKGYTFMAADGNISPARPRSDRTPAL